MEASRKQILKIDFRPRRQQPYRYLVVALFLLGGVMWWGWRWIAPYDHAHFIEQQLETANPEQLTDLLKMLPGLEAPGYRVLFGALGHPQHEVRRAARASMGELLDRWQRDPTQQPVILAELTIMLAERASPYPENVRQESQDLFRRWVNLATPEKVNAKLSQREFHARRQLLDWVAEPRLAQPPRLRGQQRAERMTMVHSLLANSTIGISSGAERSAANHVAVASETSPQNETTFRVVAVANEVAATTPRELVKNELLAESPLVFGGQTNRAIHLPRGPNNESHPSTPLHKVVNETPIAGRSATAALLMTADLLSTNAPARYCRASPLERRQLLAEYQAAGYSIADLELLELYASAPSAALIQTINTLPQRTEIQGQLWLRQFAVHSDSAVRRAAWSWLVTSPDRATRLWLAEQAAAESDPDLREWYQVMTKQRKTR